MVVRGETYEWKVFRISWAGLYQEFVPPAVQGIEALRVVNVVDKHTTVSAPVESDAERLKSLLTGCIPELPKYQPFGIS